MVISVSLKLLLVSFAMNSTVYVPFMARVKLVLKKFVVPMCVRFMSTIVLFGRVMLMLILLTVALLSVTLAPICMSVPMAKTLPFAGVRSKTKGGWLSLTVKFAFSLLLKLLLVSRASIVIL